MHDDRPFPGPALPAAIFYYLPDRSGQHPRQHLADYIGIPLADAYAGFDDLYFPSRKPGAVTEAGCWARGRHKLFELAEGGRTQIAVEAVRRVDAIFDAWREIKGLPPDQHLAVRKQHVTPLVTDLEAWMRGERGKLSHYADVTKAMDYMLRRWPTFIRFLNDGWIGLTNNAAERAARGIAVGRKAWLFAGTGRGGE